MVGLTHFLSTPTGDTIMKSNNITIIGNLGKKPTIHRTKEGRKFTAISIATDSFYLKNGEWHKRKAVWHKVIVFTTYVIGQAEKFDVGDKVEISGYISYRAITSGDKKFNEAIIIAQDIREPRPSTDQAIYIDLEYPEEAAESTQQVA